ncbi:unannotated protein [freshwater metagenome]|uniref:Unannotated protein n=1 Tax=freshwater metagenome TaxID=449393 RepID=A0A6J6GFF8_9ZZZZ
MMNGHATTEGIRCGSGVEQALRGHRHVQAHVGVGRRRTGVIAHEVHDDVATGVGVEVHSGRRRLHDHLIGDGLTGAHDVQIRGVGRRSPGRHRRPVGEPVRPHTRVHRGHVEHHALGVGRHRPRPWNGDPTVGCHARGVSRVEKALRWGGNEATFARGVGRHVVTEHVHDHVRAHGCVQHHVAPRAHLGRHEVRHDGPVVLHVHVRGVGKSFAPRMHRDEPLAIGLIGGHVQHHRRGVRRNTVNTGHRQNGGGIRRGSRAVAGVQDAHRIHPPEGRRPRRGRRGHLGAHAGEDRRQHDGQDDDERRFHRSGSTSTRNSHEERS